MNKIFKMVKILYFIILLYTFISIKFDSISFSVQSNTLSYTAAKQEKQAFIDSISDAAVKDMKENGVFASVTMGQAIIESGWGKDNIAKMYNNYFGMKNSASVYLNGEKIECNASNVNVVGQTQSQNKYWSGKAVCLGASEGGYSWFRVYDGVLNSIGDHSRNFWCHSDGRYIKNGVFAAKNASEQLYAIMKAGYAGSDYYDNIYNPIIVSNGLLVYDEEFVPGVKPDYANSCTNETYEGKEPEDPSNSNNNNVYDFNTTYTGDYEKGYIFFSQKDNLLSGTRADKIESKINTIIKNIFNKTNYLENNNSNNDYEIPTNNPDAKSWKQYDSSWGHIPLGNSSENIKSAGCLVTSVSIQIKLSGTSLTTENFNPGTFVKYLNQHSGFEGALFKWSGAWKGLAPKFDFVSKDALPSSKEAKINKIREILNSGYYPVMCVKKNCGHWVAVTGVTSDNINIADPGSTSTTVFPKYNAIANDNTLKVAYFKLSN